MTARLSVSKLRSLLEAAGNLVTSGAATGPLPGLLEPLDTDRISRNMKLQERGTERGKRELPNSEQVTFDEVEQAVVQEINDAWTIQKGQVIGTLRALRQTVERFNVKAKLA